MMTPVDRELLIRIDERTAAVHRMLEKHLDEDGKIHQDHEQRIRKNEKFRLMILGAVILTASGSGALAKFLL